MRLSRKGVKRDHGATTLFTDNDVCNCFRYKNGEGIWIRVTARRTGDSSYEYDLHLSGEEVMDCLLTLPAAEIPKALKSRARDSALPLKMLEILRQLAAGTIEAPNSNTNS